MRNQIKSLFAKFKQQQVQKRRLYIILTAIVLVITLGMILALVQTATATTGNILHGKPGEYTDVRSAQIADGGVVHVYAKPNTIPKDVELNAEVLSEYSEEYAKAVKQLKYDGVDYDFMKALDISLRNSQGEEVEPQEPVYVVMDVGAILPKEASYDNIRIQHHKEILSSQEENGKHNNISIFEEPKIELETVLDAINGLVEQDANSCMAAFPVDSFSVFTVTSTGWKDLNIKIQCVDEYGNELLSEHKPDDIHWGNNYTPGASFDIPFMTKEHPQISGYQYDSKAYFMRDGAYESRIYGLRREQNKWFYYSQDGDKSKKAEFTPQPDFLGEKPKDFIRLVYKKVMEIPVVYLDDAGSFEKLEIPLKPEDAPNRENPSQFRHTGTELDISNTDLLPKSNTFFFVGKAYVGEPDPENEVIKVIRQNGLLYGVTPEENKLPISSESPLKLLYHKTQTGTPDIMQTVSTRDKGLKINLFDYNSGDNSGLNEGINAGKKLQFIQDSSRKQEYNRWTGKDGGIYKGIVDEKLVNGYPTIDGESLDYLFDPEICREELAKPNGTIKHIHTDLDHLFWRDRDGYYHYDSMTNFATIMDKTDDGGGHNPNHTDGGNFIVYKQPALPGSTGTGDNPKFLPFNTYSEANVPTKEPATSDKIKQYHFGMTMESEFIIPPGGVIPDADGDHTGMRDMIFEFNGDDDMWVFIDEKLVLDLGGIHDRYGGTINFRTGEVTTDAPPTENSGLKQPNIYGIDDPSKLTENELEQAREKAGFGKFSQHNFKFFYLERGRGASNCEIRFNLVPVEHGLMVGKRLPENMDGAATEHMWYEFQAEAEHNGFRHPLANAAYSVIKWEPGEDPINGGQMVEARKTDEQGRFLLRAGERADFIGAVDLKQAGTAEHDKVTIHISEIVKNDVAQPQVTAWSGKEKTPGTYIEIKDDNGQIIRKQVPALYDSSGYEFHTDNTKEEVRQIAGNGETLYQVDVTSAINNKFNWVDFENNPGVLSGLNINKVARHTDGTPIQDAQYAIKVELWDTRKENWVPLPVGSDYWILNENEKPAENTKLHLDESAQGLIYIQDGQWIHLHVLPGTKYRVSEVLSSQEANEYTTTYEGTIDGEENGLEIMTDENGKPISIGNNAGIVAGSQHNVTITNVGDPILMPKGSFVLTKEVSGVIPDDIKFHFDLRIADYATGYTDEYLPVIQCEATYYGTPDGERGGGNPKNGIKETLTFTPTTINNGPDATPISGENYESSLFLYPGEIVVIKGLPEGKAMYVEEVFAQEQNGHYDVSFQEEGQNKVLGTVLNATVGKISKDGVLKVTCINSSNLQSTSILEISKKVRRNNRPNGEPTYADKKKEFSFRITQKNPVGFEGGEVQAEIEASDGTKRPMSLTFVQSGEDYIANAKLKHGETLIIQGLPIDIDVIVQEIDCNGYVVSMNDTPGDTAHIRLTQNTGQAYEVNCVNTIGAELPDTGGHGSLPYYLLGTVLLCAAGLLLYRRNKSHESM